MEAIACIRAIANGMHPADHQLRVPRPECDLDYVPNQARRADVETSP